MEWKLEGDFAVEKLSNIFNRPSAYVYIVLLSQQPVRWAWPFNQTPSNFIDDKPRTLVFK